MVKWQVAKDYVFEWELDGLLLTFVNSNILVIAHTMYFNCLEKYINLEEAVIQLGIINYSKI